jgi:hypothetical protein
MIATTTMSIALLYDATQDLLDEESFEDVELRAEPDPSAPGNVRVTIVVREK